MSTGFINNAEKFFDTIKMLVKNELDLTQKIESRVYALVKQKSGDETTHVTMKELPNKDFNEMGDLFKAIAETALHITGFRHAMREDGFEEIALYHVEVFKNTGEENKTIVTLVKLIPSANGEIVQHEKEAFELVGGKVYVTENGDVKTERFKLVPSDYLDN